MVFVSEGLCGDTMEKMQVAMVLKRHPVCCRLEGLSFPFPVGGWGRGWGHVV
jgi:hypothetical protein